MLPRFRRDNGYGGPSRRVFLLPARFSHARYLAGVREFAEADAAYAVFAQIAVRPAADLTPVIAARGELGFGLLL